MAKTVYVTRDGSGIFMFSTRPVFETDKGDSEANGIWSESADGRLIMELSTVEAIDLLGFAPENGQCWDVNTICTMIEKVDA